MKKVFYKTDSERNQAILDETGLGFYLIEDAITIEGNYLNFDTSPQSSISEKNWTFEKLISILKSKNVIKDTDL